ncbi:MAG: DUF3795 domain-containing protein [Candidatus Delongbacteria bacterium]|nr:DUF3795 domain-containing protein [Candidatus Delongbacteria bacterium]
MIGHCGLCCHECPAYLAMKNDDNKLRAETAQKWSEDYGADIKPEDINCQGCFSSEVVFSHCNVCEMRQCSMEKGLPNCAYCDIYPCDILSKFFEYVPTAKEQLDKVKNSL